MRSRKGLVSLAPSASVRAPALLRFLVGDALALGRAIFLEVDFFLEVVFLTLAFFTFFLNVMRFAAFFGVVFRVDFFLAVFLREATLPELFFGVFVGFFRVERPAVELGMCRL